MLVQFEGLISSVTLPDGWSEMLIADQDLAVRVVRTFKGPEGTDAQIRVIRRLKSLTPEVSQRFSSCLAGEHILDNQEWDGLVPVVGDIADPSVFRVSSAEVREINERLVLWLKGEYPGQNYAAGICFTHGVTGDLEELWFLAPADGMIRLSADYESVVKSVTWRDL